MSFAELLNVHGCLNELFLLHQEALLRLDLELAAELLRIYERELRAHMRVEEDLLMPVYERAGKIAGGPPGFFIGEHRRMLEFLARFAATLDELKGVGVMFFMSLRSALTLDFQPDSFSPEPLQHSILYLRTLEKSPVGLFADCVGVERVPFHSGFAERAFRSLKLVGLFIKRQIHPSPIV